VLTFAYFRTLTTAIVVTSIGCHFGILPYTWFYFSPYRLLRIPPEIWRPFTAYFLSTPKLGIILDPYFVYQYMTQLEMASTKFPRKADLLWYLLTVGTFIIVSFCLPQSPGPILVFPISCLSLHLSCRSAFDLHLNISARIVLTLSTIAVPGIEEDNPCTSACPSFA
jgi:hypothetical protein